MNRRSLLKSLLGLPALMFMPLAARSKRSIKPLLTIPRNPDVPSSAEYVSVDEVARITDGGWGAFAKKQGKSIGEWRAEEELSLNLPPGSIFISYVYLKGWDKEKPSFNQTKVIGSTAFAEDLKAEYERLVKEAE